MSKVSYWSSPMLALSVSEKIWLISQSPFFAVNYIMGLIDSNLTQKMFSLLYLCCYHTSNLNEPNLPKTYDWQSRARSPLWCTVQPSASLCLFEGLWIWIQITFPHVLYTACLTLLSENKTLNLTMSMYVYTRAQWNTSHIPTLQHRSISQVPGHKPEKPWNSVVRDHRSQPVSSYLGSWHSQTGAGSRLLRGK